MRLPARRRDDADVIRARLRALLAETQGGRGWVPPAERDDPDDPDGWDDRPGAPQVRGAEWTGGTPEAGDDAEADEWDDGADDDPGRVGVLPSGVGRHRAPGVTARLDPGRSGTWTLWVAGLLAAIAVIGWTWADRPEVEQVPVAATSGSAAPSGSDPRPDSAGPGATASTTPSSAATVVVSVVGQVATPGLVTLPAGSRVADALAAAGGLLPDADPAGVNAAALLVDGQQIAVGVPGAAPPAVGSSAAAGATGLLNLNAATVADLEALPGIGPVLAQRIVDHRAKQGPFASVDELDDVSGIGPAIYADLAERVTV